MEIKVYKATKKKMFGFEDLSKKHYHGLDGVLLELDGECMYVSRGYEPPNQLAWITMSRDSANECLNIGGELSAEVSNPEKPPVETIIKYAPDYISENELEIATLKTELAAKKEHLDDLRRLLPGTNIQISGSEKKIDNSAIIALLKEQKK